MGSEMCIRDRSSNVDVVPSICSNIADGVNCILPVTPAAVISGAPLNVKTVSLDIPATSTTSN